MTVLTDTAVVVYGVCEAGGDVRADWPDRAELRWVTHRGLAALVRSVEPHWQPGRQDVLDYTGTLDALAAEGTVIPVRFGSVMADDAAVADHLLAPSEQRLTTLLGALADTTQVQVHACYVQEAVLAEVVADDPQVRALRERTRGLADDAGLPDRMRLGELTVRAVADRAVADREVVWGVLARHVRAHRERPVSGFDVLNVAALVERQGMDALAADLEALATATHDRLKLRLIGPSAPYDFVADE